MPASLNNMYKDEQTVFIHLYFIAIQIYNIIFQHTQVVNLAYHEELDCHIYLYKCGWIVVQICERKYYLYWLISCVENLTDNEITVFP